MRPYPFVTLDVFTDRRFGGNPLAVFPDAAGLDDAGMQALAREFNLSETTFVLPPKDPANTAQVRIFTPQSELPFAGHPNVGTAWVLAGMGRDREGVLRFEEAAGLVEIRVERTGGALDGALAACRVAAPKPLEVGEAPDPDSLAACAGLEHGEVGEGEVASVGTSAVFAPVSADALAHAVPDPAAFRATAARLRGFASRFLLYLYARDGGTVRARAFGPLLGIPEDPATGSAAASLAALLTHRDGVDRARFTIHQGVEMGRPSVIHAGAERGADGVRAWIAGACVPVLRGETEPL